MCKKKKKGNLLRSGNDEWANLGRSCQHKPIVQEVIGIRRQASNRERETDKECRSDSCTGMEEEKFEGAKKNT